MSASLFCLFAFFTGKGEDGMRLAYSADGLAWEPLGERSFIRPQRDLMRDPFLYRGPDGVFHLLWTVNWESQEIGYASSNDLVNWSAQRRLPVMRDVPGTRNCWAPEMVFDPQTQQFLIFWSSTVEGRFENTADSSESGYNHRIWRTTTRDFTRFSEPEVYFDPGFSVIDATLLLEPDGAARVIAKNETLEPVAKDLFHCRADSVFGPFSQPSPPFSEAWVEGPAAVRWKDRTLIYFDVYRDKRYGALATYDFKQWEDVSHQTSFPAGARHGSFLPICQAELATLQAAVAAQAGRLSGSH